MQPSSMSPEPPPRRSWWGTLVIAGVALTAWLLLRHERDVAPAVAPERGAPETASSGTAREASPAGITSRSGAPEPAHPGTAPEPEFSGAAATGQTEAPAVTAASVDERQDAKIARGLASAPDGGLVVQSTPPASVTAALRLQPGDVIVTVNGTSVSTPADFVRVYRAQGMPSELTILRGGQEMHLH